ncbi:hypothetical protein L596_012891 [Steinernema carpocapsae]|uniref:G-protein coupled receptors family 1 profile domain-containing protein n=1 Tax=Steinernema carpocapsae TaxID=34508 RepID=A0A4V6A4Y8_STECR|nr:hypothetical protein L596_012891 [Steinernema carpocapsae]
MNFTPNGSDGGIAPDYREYAQNVGLIYVFLGVIFIPLSAFVFSVIVRPPLIKHNCYKIMALTTVLDIGNLINAAVVTGIFSIKDIHHCKNEWVLTATEFLTHLWFTYCCASEILALNRMLEFANRNVAVFLFEGKRVYFWFLIVVAYSITLMYMVSDRVYFYNPYGGIFIMARFSGQPNYVHLFNNFFKFGFITTCYSVMLFFMHRRLRTTSTIKISKFQIKVSVQTLAIAALADGVALGYLMIGYLPLSPEMAQYAGTAGELLYISLHGGTALIYLFMNNAVNAKFKSIFCGAAPRPISDVSLTETKPKRTSAVAGVGGTLPPGRKGDQ